MKEIEEGIHEIHARAREQKDNEKETKEDTEMAGKLINPPFRVSKLKIENNLEFSFCKIWKNKPKTFLCSGLICGATI